MQWHCQCDRTPRQTESEINKVSKNYRKLHDKTKSWYCRNDGDTVFHKMANTQIISTACSHRSRVNGSAQRLEWHYGRCQRSRQIILPHTWFPTQRYAIFANLARHEIFKSSCRVASTHFWSIPIFWNKGSFTCKWVKIYSINSTSTRVPKMTTLNLTASGQ